MAVPSQIRKLDETVVNRIAAGEVIQRPANALKELLENCLDAKATNIHINVKNGGMKLLQIVDNGTGIRKEDLDIVCERFTTSKLRKFEDLSSIATYGFRGEGLASISHVAHLTIVTKTSDSPCAYKASYTDGKLNGQPKPCAGNQGTNITVEDLFYNLNTRRKALKTTYEEHAKIADVVGSYAIHNEGVGFCLKKVGENTACIRTQVNATCVENICSVYGNNLARELMDVKLENKQLDFKMTGQISNANYSTRKLVFLLFINHRLVGSAGIRKVVDQVYGNYLPKGGHPFVYLSLEINPNNVDVNVHPTKHEVHFLHEEEITEKIREAIETRLVNCNTSRVFYTQSRLPTLKPSEARDFDSGASTSQLNSSRSDVAPPHMVRTDSSQQKMQRFLSSDSAEKEKAQETEGPDKKSSPTEGGQPDVRGWRDIELNSVLNLRKAIEDECHSAMRGILRNHSFVGCVSRGKALIQHHTSLYLCDTWRLSEELFYQIMMYQFGNFGMIKFSESIPLYDLGLLGLKSKDSGWKESDGPQEELAEFIARFLASKSAMLLDYFSINIEPDGALLKGVPILIDGFLPRAEDLPMWVLRLATEVEWGDEELCFQTFCREMARFYAQSFKVSNHEEDDEEDDDGGGLEGVELDEGESFGKESKDSGESMMESQSEDAAEISASQEDAKKNTDDKSKKKSWKYVVEHEIYSALRKTLLPPKQFAKDGTILQIAYLPDLYKVFERC